MKSSEEKKKENQTSNIPAILVAPRTMGQIPGFMKEETVSSKYTTYREKYWVKILPQSCYLYIRRQPTNSYIS